MQIQSVKDKIYLFVKVNLENSIWLHVISDVKSNWKGTFQLFQLRVMKYNEEIAFDAAFPELPVSGHG